MVYAANVLTIDTTAPQNSEKKIKDPADMLPNTDY